ncbi:MAG: hypothetical protein KC454_08920 [Flavobacteriales bacterium]|nr:hypothetical protein [Flavobacteriales bacterium]
MITIWSSKGGVGKTSIAVELSARLGAGIITNEANSRLPMFSFLKNKYYVLEHEQTLGELNINQEIVFDFGGMVDPRVLEAVEISQYILMPVTPSMIDIQKCAEDIEGILMAFRSACEDFSEDEIRGVITEVLNKIVIIVNKSIMESESQSVVLQISNILQGGGVDHQFKHFTVPESRALKNMHAEMKSITQMIESSHSPMLLKRSYGKVNNAFEEITQFIIK